MMPSGPLPSRRDRFPDMSWARATFYRFAQRLCRVFFFGVYRWRVLHRERVPLSGPLLIVSNHQSHFDPPAIGSPLRRSTTFLARDTLFRALGFRWLIRTLGAVPIKREESDTAAMKRTIELLRRGHAVLAFPEGTRTPDGTIRPFKRGIAVLIKRAKCRVLPVAVEGAFNAWPKGDRPHIGGRRIAICYGDPIDSEELMKDGPDKALEFLALEIDALRLEARAFMWNDTNGEYPPPGFADDTIDINLWRTLTCGYRADPETDPEKATAPAAE